MALAPTRRSLASLRRLVAGHPLVSSLDVELVTSVPSGPTKLPMSGLAGGLDSNRYINAWVMPVDGTAANNGVIRRTGQSSLNTSSGELTLATALPATAAVDDEIEVHRLLPPRRHEGRTGIRECINQALQELWLPDRISLAGVTGQPSYTDLFTNNDWADPEAIYELYGPQYDSTQNRTPWPVWGVTRDADTTAIEAVGLGTGDTAQVQTTRPGDTLAKVGGVWTTVTGGLANDTDETLFQPNLVLSVALVHVFNAVAHGDDRDHWLRLAKAQKAKADMNKLNWLWHPSQRTNHSGVPYRSGAKSFSGMFG